MKILDHVRAVDKELSAYINIALLAIAEYADVIMRAVSDNLSSLAPYVSAEVLRNFGIAVFVFNVIRAAQRARKSVKEGGNG
jgi:hypothetical protein